MTDILDWINDNRSGNITETCERIEIAHHSGEYSTLWKRKGVVVPDELFSFTELYDKYDGIDLFSSTFKIASINDIKSKNNVNIVFNLASLKTEIEKLRIVFPEFSTPFMYQSGIGYYAYAANTGTIFEWDDEANVISAEYHSLTEVLDEWLAAIS